MYGKEKMSQMNQIENLDEAKVVSQLKKIRVSLFHELQHNNPNVSHTKSICILEVLSTRNESSTSFAC